MGTDAAISSSQLVNEDGGRLVSPYVTVPPGWGDHWYRARHEAGVRQVKVAGHGDSNMSGAGSNDSFNLAWFARYGTALKALYGDGGTGYLPWEVNNAFTGTFSYGVGFGGARGRLSGAGSLSWTALRGTQIQIFHENTATPTGSYRYRVDGGGFTTVTPPTDVAIEPGCITISGLADTTHSLDIERVSGQIGIYGVYATRPTGIVMQRCSLSGRAAGDYSQTRLLRLSITTNSNTTINTPGAGSFASWMIGRNIAATGIPADATITAVASATSATISAAATASATVTATISVNSAERLLIPSRTIEPAFALAPGLGRPDLVVIGLGPNDANNPDYTVDSMIEGISAILRPLTAGPTITTSPDVILIIEHMGDYFDQTSIYPAMMSAVASMAQGAGAALIDIWGSGRRSWKFWDNHGYFFDAIHPSNAGHAAYAAPIIELCTRNP